jgi:hypothetical protein
MKKVLALVICSVFVLSMSSFAFWGMGKKAETKTATCETKGKVMTKAEKEVCKKNAMKKEIKVKKTKKVVKKGATPAVPAKK